MTNSDLVSTEEFRDPILQDSVLKVEEILRNNRELTRKLDGAGIPASPLRRLAMEVVSVTAKVHKEKSETLVKALQQAYDNLMETYSKKEYFDLELPEAVKILRTALAEVRKT
jgi:hypothetical protein